jgi:TRAP-type uncharacterized transport system substrate-binding protein
MRHDNSAAQKSNADTSGTSIANMNKVCKRESGAALAQY